MWICGKWSRALAAGCVVVAAQKGNEPVQADRFGDLEVLRPRSARQVAGLERRTDNAHRLIDGSGLTEADVPLHGLDATHGYATVGTAWYTDEIPESEGDSYFRAEGVEAPALLFALPGRCDIHGVAIWNYPGTSEGAANRGRGARRVAVEIADDAAGPWAYLGETEWVCGQASDAGEPVQVNALSQCGTGRWVRLTVTDNYRKDRVGLAEVRFLGHAQEAAGPAPVRVWMVGDEVIRGGEGLHSLRLPLQRIWPGRLGLLDLIGTTAGGGGGVAIDFEDQEHDGEIGRTAGETARFMREAAREMSELPDYVVLCVGRHDLEAGATPEEVLVRIRRCVRRAERSNREARVLVCTLPLPTDEALAEQVQILNQMLVQVASGRNPAWDVVRLDVAFAGETLWDETGYALSEEAESWAAASVLGRIRYHEDAAEEAE